MAGRTVTVHVGGKDRRLLYDLNAIAEIGERLGITVQLDRLDTFGQDLIAKPLPLRVFRILFWAGFIHDEPDLREEDVGRWVTAENAPEMIERFFALVSTTFSDLGLGPNGSPPLAASTSASSPTAP